MSWRSPVFDPSGDRTFLRVSMMTCRRQKPKDQSDLTICLSYKRSGPVKERTNLKLILLLCNTIGGGGFLMSDKKPDTYTSFHGPDQVMGDHDRKALPTIRT